MRGIARRLGFVGGCASLTLAVACSNAGGAAEGAEGRSDALLVAPAPAPAPVLARGLFVYDRALEGRSVARTGQDRIVVSTSGALRRLDVTTAIYDGRTASSVLTADASGAFVFSTATAPSAGPTYAPFRVPATAALGATWPAASERPYGSAFVASLDATGVAQIDVPAHTIKAVTPVAGGRVLRVATIFRRHVAPTSYAANLASLAPEIAPGDHGVVGVATTYLAIADQTNEVVVLGSAQAFAHGSELPASARPTFEQRALVRGAAVTGTRLSLADSQMNAPLAAVVSAALSAVPSTRDALLAATRND